MTIKLIDLSFQKEHNQSITLGLIDKKEAVKFANPYIC